jgi:hypothetical protein
VNKERAPAAPLLILRAGALEIGITTSGDSGCLLMPGVALALLVYGHQFAAAVTSGLWDLYVFYRLVMIPFRWRRRGLRKAAAERAAERLRAMVNAWNAARGTTMNPTRLKELVLLAEGRGAAFPSVLHTLIDRAIKRDPTALVR